MNESAPRGHGAPRYLWIIHNTYLRWLWKDLAAHLAKQTGLLPILIVKTEQDKRFYSRQFGEAPEFEIVVDEDPYDVIVGGGTGRPGQQIIGRARKIEEEFGISLMRELILADRHLGRGFLLGGSGHPRSLVSEAATLDLTYDACVAKFDHYEELIARFPPALVTSFYSGTGLSGKPLALICRRDGIPYRTLTPARFGDLMYWAEDEYEGCSALSKRLAEPTPALTEAEVEAALRTLVPSGFATNEPMRRLARRRQRWFGILKEIALLTAKHWYGRLRRYHFARTRYLWTSVVAQLLRTRRHFRELNRLALPEVPAVDGRKIVFFPLQQEPEASILGLAPEHSNQMATVAELALSLPADALLVVKEHIWQVGRRPEGFYRTLCEFPNLLLIKPEASSLAIIQRAALVCTITSSAGFEAAALGKPVVFFWERSPLRVLPHVHAMPRFAGIDRIRSILADDDEAARKKRAEAGAAYLKRIREFCIDFGPLAIHGRTDRPTPAELDLIVRPLLTNLPRYQAATATLRDR